MSLLNSMKITQKLILAFLCVIGVALLCTGMIYWQRSALETRSVVAELRPSAERPASLLISLA
jgi:CHASE3 domain sensor protein